MVSAKEKAGLGAAAGAAVAGGPAVLPSDGLLPKVSLCIQYIKCGTCQLTWILCHSVVLTFEQLLTFLASSMQIAGLKIQRLLESHDSL